MLIRSDARKGVIGFLPGEYAPCDPGKLVGHRDRDHAEGLLLAELPTPVSHWRWLVFDVPHHGGGADNEQPSQVSVTLL